MVQRSSSPARSSRFSTARARPQPLRVSIAIRGETVRLIAHSVNGVKSVGPIDATSLLEKSAQLCALLETESCREPQLRTVVRELSTSLLDPIESAIDGCSDLVVNLPRGPLGIPLDLLTYRRSPLFLKRPVSYRIGKTGAEPSSCELPLSAFILSDRTADPERACLAIAALLGRVTYQDDREATLDFLHLQTRKDVIVFSLHGRVGGKEPDHMQMSTGKVLPDDLNGLQPRLVYLDSCRLGVSRTFLNRFRAMGTKYYVAPIISNEAGESSTRTMTLFFKHLIAGKPPEVALFLTRKELWHLYRECDARSRWWRSFAFRVYRLN